MNMNINFSMKMQKILSKSAYALVLMTRPDLNTPTPSCTENQNAIRMELVTFSKKDRNK